MMVVVGAQELFAAKWPRAHPHTGAKSTIGQAKGAPASGVAGSVAAPQAPNGTRPLQPSWAFPDLARYDGNNTVPTDLTSVATTESKVDVRSVPGPRTAAAPGTTTRIEVPRRRDENTDVYRIDIPCSALHVTPPPCPLTCWVMRSGKHWSAHVETPPGRPAHVARWLAGLMPAQVYIEQGLAPTSLWVRFEEALEDLSLLLDGLTVKRLELTPAGTATAFVQGPPERTKRLEALAAQTGPSMAMREAMQPSAAAGLTRRQREALAQAVALGYYEVPRRANLHEVAQRMGMSTGAASELLRRGERILIGSFFDDVGRQASGQA